MLIRRFVLSLVALNLSMCLVQALELLRGEIKVDATPSPSRQITHEDAKPQDE